MKKDSTKIEKEIEEVLSSFDDAHRASPRPFFYARLTARMENRKEAGIGEKHALSPSMVRVLAVMTFFLLVVNIFTVSRFLGSPSSESAVTDASQMFIEEYYPDTPTMYNLENTINP